MIVVLTAGIITFFLLFVAFNLSKEHSKLQVLFFLAAATFGLVLLPSLALESSCEPLVESSTVVGNTTSYTYTTVCNTSDTTGNPGTTLYKSTVWLYRFFWAYIIVALSVWALKHLGIVKEKQKGGRK